MSKENYYVTTIGKKTYEKFEQKIKDDLFTEKMWERRIEESADLIEQFPFVMRPLRDNGFLLTPHGAEVLHIFRPNMYAQDFAHGNGNLHKMTISTAVERGMASAEYTLERSLSLWRHLKKVGRTEQDFISIKQAMALIEGGYYTLIGGEEVPYESERKIQAGLMRRLLRYETIMTKIARQQGIDLKDSNALTQIAESLRLKEVLKVFYENDPYFNGMRH